MININLAHLKDVNQDRQTFNYFDWILSECKLSGKTVLDLGTGHGKFAIRCRDFGMKVTAVDGRPDRIPFHEKDIDWQVMDVNDFNVSGYDVVLFLGLLYHLTYDQQVSLLSRLDCQHLIINTHVALVKSGGIVKPSPEEKFTVINDGLIYREAHNLQELHSRPLAALNNLTAFWPTVKALEELVNDAGFEISVLTPWIYSDRTFFVCTRR